MKKRPKSNLKLKKFVFKLRMAEFPKVIVDNELIEKILNSTTNEEFEKYIGELPKSINISPEFLNEGLKKARINYKKSKKSKKPTRHKIPKNTDGQRSVWALYTPMGNKR